MFATAPLSHASKTAQDGELLASARAPERLTPAQQGEAWADYTAEPDGRLELQLMRKPEASGWVWSGYCWSGDES